MPTTATSPARRTRDTSAAVAAIKRNAEERRAQVMRERGWVCIPPDRLTPALRDELAPLNADRPVPGGKPSALPTNPLVTVSAGPE